MDVRTQPQPGSRINLAILQPTSLCNLNCTYCYVSDRMNGTVMTDEVVRQAARWVYRALPASQTSVSFLWHAGEPFAAGLAFYRRAFDIIESEAPAAVRPRFVFQTNATLVTDAWCDLFAGHDVTIGVSIDGPKHIHDANRVSWSKRGSFDRTMRGVETLRKRGYDPTAICVLTPASLAEPDSIYEFFLENGFPSVGFNVEESEGVYGRSRHLDDTSAAIRSAYVKFMRRVWARQVEDGARLRIREFERTLGMIEHLRRDPEFVPVPDEVIPFANLLITREGAISTFAPELASTPSADYNDFIIGHVATDTLDDVVSGATLARIAKDIDAGRRACKGTCAYYPVCGGGYQSNRYAEHKSLEATETSTCSLHRKALVDMMMTELAKL